MSPSTVRRRSRMRRAGESAYGLLLLAKAGLTALLVVLLLAAGAWTSWDTAEPAMFPEDGKRGTFTVEKCGTDRCHGSFTPRGDGGRARDGVSISRTVAEGRGRTLDVALRTGSAGDGPDAEAVRTGPAGTLYAWVPLAGALLLASVVVAGGLRLRRTAWVLALLGVGVMGASALTL
ncbi:hypothetical protein [Streptomyces phytohabitans]|uniref:hypothetical protein n=1 Tax=Streptomyces phytohabitans TaxID=1150371 RepID=UPI00345C5DE4